MASNVLNDWAWKPDAVALAALKRGEAKDKERRRAALEDIINFNLSSAARKKTKKALRVEEQARVDIFVYQLRVGPKGLLRGKMDNWATLLYFMMSETKAIGRYKDREEAKKAIEAFKDKNEYDSFSIVTPDEDIRHFDNNVLDGIFKQFGDPRMGLKKEQRQQAARYYCSVFDKRRHGADGALLKPYKLAPIEGLKEKKMENVETVEGTDEATTPVTKGKKAKKAPAKKAAKKAKPVKAKAKGKAVKTAPTATKKANGASVPRAEGKAAIIKIAINSGKTYDQVMDIVKEKCINTDKVNKAYVMWYYHQMAKKGELTPAAKKAYAK